MKHEAINRVVSTIVLLVMMLCALPELSWAFGIIQGFVRDDSGQPIDGATIQTDWASTTSTLDGSYFIAHPAGTYTFTASADGYMPQSIENVAVVDNNTTDLDFALSKFALQLDAVYPTLGQLGQALDVTLTGTGFDENTRVSMYLDSGNREKIIGSVDTPDKAWGVTVVGSIAYVADGGSGLQVTDISDPANPVIIGSVDTPDFAKEVVVAGSIAYVADRNGGLQVIDISDPANPIIIGSVDTPGGAYGVAVAGNKAYVACAQSGLKVIDVDPTSSDYLTIIGSLGDISASDITVVGSYAFVPDYYDLQVIDVSNPNNPAVIGFVDTPQRAFAVTVAGSTAYVADSADYSAGGLTVIDVSNPANPAFISSVDTPGNPREVAVAGSIAYVADDRSGLTVIDISDPADPTIIGSVNTPDAAKDVTVVGSIAYVADYLSGLQVIDVSDPTSTTIIGSVDTPRSAYDVTVVGSIAYVADGLTSGLQVIDISDPADPYIIGSVVTPNAKRVTVAGSYAYVADQVNGLRVIDIDPESPDYLTIVNPVDTYDGDQDVTVVGSIAYVADGNNGLKVVDVSDPTDTIVIGAVDTPGQAMGITVVGSTAYLATWNYGLYVIDITDPTDPTILGSVDTPYWAEGVDVVGSYAYVADYGSGLQVIDISDPTDPVITGSVRTPSAEYYDVVVVGSIAYVADAASGLQVIDVSDPTDPTILGSVDTPGNAFGLTLVGNTAYVAAGSSGLTILPIPVEITPVTVSSSSVMTATLPGPQISGNYTLRVFNSGEDNALPGAVTFTDNPDLLTSKAIIVAGGGPDAPGDIWEETKTAANKAYDVLINQGYDHDSIYYLSLEIGNQYVDNPSLDIFLEDAITNWASDASELLIYFVDHGEPDNFILYANNSYTQDLSATQLDGWLDTLQQTMTGPVTFIYDACQSGTFVSRLRPPENRTRYIITGSSAEPAYFLDQGTMSFSYQFWDNILMLEGNLGNAFTSAGDLMNGYQTALLDANGNGIPNEDGDYILAGTSVIRRGSPVHINVHPMIDAISESLTLYGTASATITAEGVTDADSVWAQIIPPDINPDVSGIPITDLDTVELTDPDEDGVYEGTYNNFTVAGTYVIIVKARAGLNIYSYIAGEMTTQNIYSQPLVASVLQTDGTADAAPDSYETDDAFGQAGVIVINDPNPQPHTFHVANDEDWVKFYGLAGNTYKIKAGNVSVVNDAAIELYGTDGTSLIRSVNDAGAGNDEFIDWTCTQDGIYFVRVTNANSNFGENVKYDLTVYRPIGAGTGMILGRITNPSGDGVGGAAVKSNVDTTAVTLPDGNYLMVIPQGNNYVITVTAAGYETAARSGISVSAEGITTLNVSMLPASDTDTDNDGLPDNYETNTGTYANATDTGTDPNSADTDGDGLIDGNEVNIYGTNPVAIDSDSDGMPDGWEVNNGLNPLADDAGDDHDGDGASNLLEYKRGTDPIDSGSRPAFLPWLILLLS